MNKKNYKRLAKFERYMTTAYNAHYITGVTRKAASEIAEIYNETYNAHETTTTCTKCVLRWVTRLAKDWFAMRDAEEAKAKPETTESETNVSETEVEQ